jgi:hypothetical protein
MLPIQQSFILGISLVKQQHHEYLVGTLNSACHIFQFVNPEFHVGDIFVELKA